MASWEACTQDVIVRFPDYSNEYFSLSGQLGFRLFCDLTNDVNPVIKIDVSYIHFKVHIEESSLNGSTKLVNVSKFLGNYPDLFDKDQYDLNSERDEEGNYIHTFAWPYKDFVELPQYVDISELIQSVLDTMFDNESVFGFVSTGSSSFDNFSYGVNGNEYVYSGSSYVNSAFGSVFNDIDKFSGTNATGQAKIYVLENDVHIASSCIVDKSTGDFLTYDQDLSCDVEDIQVYTPYYDTDYLYSFTIDKNTLESRGLVRYDPSYFDSVVDEAYDPYVFHGFVPVFSEWSFENTTLENKYYYEYAPMFEDFEMPVYPAPPAVGPIDDNKVFRLKSQRDSHGNIIVDQTGRPVLTWVRCERIGQE